MQKTTYQTEGMRWLKADTKAPPARVDRAAKIIHGVVLAQEGPFKTGRGEFSRDDLQSIVDLARRSPKGLKSRFSHPDESNDGLGKFLGRFRNPRMGFVHVLQDGTPRELAAVRANLHLADSSFATPSGNLGEYVMTRAEEDPDSFATSLVLEADEEFRLSADGSPAVDADGNRLPPLWHPIRLHASDVVDSGDAVDGFLGSAGSTHRRLAEARRMLREQFPGKSRAYVEQKLTTWIHCAMDARFGPSLDTAELRRQIEARKAERQASRTAELGSSPPRSAAPVFHGAFIEGRAVEWGRVSISDDLPEATNPGSFREALAGSRSIPIWLGHDSRYCLASTGDGSAWVFEDEAGLSVWLDPFHQDRRLGAAVCHYAAAGGLGMSIHRENSSWYKAGHLWRCNGVRSLLEVSITVNPMLYGTFARLANESDWPRRRRQIRLSPDYLREIGHALDADEAAIRAVIRNRY